MLENIVKEYYKEDAKNSVKVLALNGVNLSIDSGEFLSIMGPSGSGKTTTHLII